MSKLQNDPPLREGVTPEFVVRPQRVARPPTPWTWVIYEEGRAEPLRCSTRHYRCAEDAWTVGKAVLERLPKPIARAMP
jgi:hypothetical protein